MLLGMFVTTASAYDIEVPNADGVMIYYVWQNDGTELAVSYGGKNVIMGKNNYAGDVVIPESVVYEGNTYPVTGIASSAFSECPALTSVTVPNGVTSIEESAFKQCVRLTSITLGSSVESVETFAFSGCNNLKSLTFHCPVVNGEWFPQQVKEVVIGSEVQSLLKKMLPRGLMLLIV